MTTQPAEAQTSAAEDKRIEPLHASGLEAHEERMVA